MAEFYTLLYNNISSFLASVGATPKAFQSNADLLKEAYRIIHYREFWDAFNNVISFPRRDPKASKDVKVNLSKAFIDRSVDFLIGNPFRVLPDEKYASVVTPVLSYINRQAGTKLVQLETIINGSVAGDTFMKVIWDDEMKCARFQILDSEKVFVEYNSTDKVNQKMMSVTIVWDGEYEIGGTKHAVLFKEKWTAESRYLACEYIKPRRADAQRFRMDMLLTSLSTRPPEFTDLTAKDVVEVPISQETNNLGFIPVVHFRNQIVPLEVYGRSDLVDVVQLNKSLNEAGTQYLDSVHYHGTPITVIYGAKVGNLKRGPNKIWSGLPKDARVDNLLINQDFIAVKNLMELLMDFSYLVGGIPEASSGLFQNISNTTGVALQVQYLPLIGLTKRKQISYEPGFLKAYEYALRLTDKHLKLDLQKKVDEYVALTKLKMMEQRRKDMEKLDDIEAVIQTNLYALEEQIDNQVNQNQFYRVNIKWQDYLPKDSLISLNEIEREMDLGIESKRGALVRRGVEDPDSKLAEIAQEEISGVMVPNPSANANWQWDEMNKDGKDNFEESEEKFEEGEGGGSPDQEEKTAKKSEEQDDEEVQASKQR